MSINKLREKIKQVSNKKNAETMLWFFKTAKGEYGEGDIFAGITVPVQRKIAKEFLNLNFNELKDLLNSKVHEERLIALLILVEKYEKGEEIEKYKIFGFYIDNRKGINNWDLVDLSAPKIIGHFLLNKDKKMLYEFAKSDILWDRRIAILATYPFIKSGSFSDALKISDILLNDKHDLIHKAVGWMLREVGKKDLTVEEKFLRTRYNKMPRTMLRYAIEKFPETKRKKYLEGKI
ncbi:MAG TPA: DNA alkylation repair protein [Ignavibacteriaceae bacterium]|nr:DNA alkylation repair protein [Ignavibacteriaceae bacterium]